MEFAAEQNLVIPLRLDRNTIAELEESLVLCYTGVNHDSGSIHSSQKERVVSDETAAAAAREQMRLTREMKHHLLRGRLRECGSLLDAAWQAKRRFSPLVSSGPLDDIYEHAMSNGALRRQAARRGRRRILPVLRQAAEPVRLRRVDGAQGAHVRPGTLRERRPAQLEIADRDVRTPG